MPYLLFSLLQVQANSLPSVPEIPLEEEISEQLLLPVVFSDEVREMPLEEYLVGVVLGEMPASFSDEALKAQAVAARTCTLKWHYSGSNHPDGGVCVSYQCCQAYCNPEKYKNKTLLEKVRSAVQETAGQVVTYNDSLIFASYFSCSGGKTEDAVAVWGNRVPYLQSVESPGEEWADVFEETVYFSAADFAARLDLNLSGDCAKWLGKVTRTNGGGVKTMVIGGVSFTGTKLRSLLSLKSTNFTMKAEKDGIRITTVGYGHRVGMSQYGAETMARSGSSYAEILTHYYPGTRIDKWV